MSPPSGHPPRTPDGAISLPLAYALPRLWGPVGHPAMAGAIGLAFRRREPAIGEVPASRIAERPPAGGFANLLEPQPPHLPDLGFAKGPRIPALPGLGPGIARKGEGRAWLGGARRMVGDRRPLRPARPVLLDAAARPPPFSLIPIRLALPMTALRDPTPSAAAMPAALFPSRASFLRSSTASAVHSIGCSNSDRCGVPAARNGLKSGYSFPTRTQRRRDRHSPPDLEEFPIPSAS